MSRAAPPSPGSARPAAALSSAQLYLRLLRYAAPYWRVFAASIVATVLLSATEPALPALMKPILDGSFIDKDPTSIRTLPLLLVGVFFIRGVASFASTVGANWVASKVIADLSEAMFARLIDLPTAYHEGHPSGGLISKFSFDVNQVASSATEVWLTVVRDSLIVAGLLGWMVYLNWQLSLLVFGIAPLTAFLIKVVSRRLRRLSRSLQGAMGELSELVREAADGHREIKIYGAEAYERGRFAAAVQRIRGYRNKVVATSALNVPVVQMIIAMGLALLIYIASLESAKEQLTVGGFVSFFAAMGMMFAPVKRLTGINERLQRGLAAAESIFALIDEPAEPARPDRPAGPQARAAGALRFEGVGFAYPNGSRALSDITLELAAGQTVALVGPSGSGKSTLASLIPLFHRPGEGRILLDGVDIATLDLTALRRQIALVSQHVVLFNDTVAANIAYGRRDTDRAAIVAAAEAAHAMEFIRDLPEGLDTPVGPNGARLSGGQRQRIAIARALLKDAPILIMDEATSSLDSRSERAIQEALETVKRGRTTLIIAHRLSTVEGADRIVVMQEGRVHEVGSHRELLARDGLYRRLHRAQFSDRADPAAGD